MAKLNAEVLFIKCPPEWGLSERIKKAAQLTGHMTLSGFVRAAIIEKLERMALEYPELKRRRKAA